MSEFHVNEAESRSTTSTHKAGEMNLNLTMKADKPNPTFKTKGQFRSALHSFFALYHQMYPEKTYSIFNYYKVLESYDQELNLQGLMHLERKMRKTFLSNPTWLWSEEHVAVNKIIDSIRRDSTNLNASYLGSFQPRTNPNPPNQQFQKSGGQGQGQGKGGKKQFASKNQGQGQTKGTKPSKSEKCRTYNEKGKCRFGEKCFRSHLCLICNNQHPMVQCPSYTPQPQQCPSCQSLVTT